MHYGAHEKSILHSHPNVVAVFLSDGKGKFRFLDGKTQQYTSKASDAMFTPAGTHLPENTSDTPEDLVVVELKRHPAKSAMKAEMKSELK